MCVDSVSTDIIWCVPTKQRVHAWMVCAWMMCALMVCAWIVCAWMVVGVDSRQQMHLLVNGVFLEKRTTCARRDEMLIKSRWHIHESKQCVHGSSWSVPQRQMDHAWEPCDMHMESRLSVNRGQVECVWNADGIRTESR